MAKRLYKIWKSARGLKPSGEWTPWQHYTLESVISATIYTRDRVVSTDREKLQSLCDRLNFISGDDEKYEVREEPCE